MKKLLLVLLVVGLFSSCEEPKVIIDCSEQCYEIKSLLYVNNGYDKHYFTVEGQCNGRIIEVGTVEGYWEIPVVGNVSCNILELIQEGKLYKVNR
tara:strand:- start:75 stop:359 length:285 start_codon:yes stop_codon:yes gene_type:complete